MKNQEQISVPACTSSALTTADKPAANNNGRGSIMGVLIAFAILCAAGIFCISRSSSTSGTTRAASPEEEALTEAQLKQLSARIEARIQHYLLKNKVAYDQFSTSLQKAGDRYFQLAQNNIEPVSKNLGSLKTCFSLCTKMVKDKIYDSDELSKTLQEAIEPTVIFPCLQGMEQIQSEFDKFLLTLMENRNQYLADVLKAGQEPNIDVSRINPATMNNHHRALVQTTVDNAVTSVATVIGVGLEAAFIKTSVSCVTRLGATIAAKMGASAAAGATCAVVDGPLPIGDIIGGALALGGAAWTGYDVYKLASVLPGEMRASLHSLISSTRNEAITLTRSEAIRILKEYAADALPVSAQGQPPPATVQL